METGDDERVAALRGALNERCKELSLLHRVAQLLSGDNAVSEGLDELVALIPPAFLYPEQARARIRIGDNIFGCQQFPDDLPVLSEGFKGPAGVAGAVEVINLLSPDGIAPPDFLPEESELLQSLARQLDAYFQRDDTGRQLANSEYRFRALFENELDCVKVLDAERCLVEMNPAGLKLIGCPQPDELVGNRLDRFIHRDDLNEYIRLHGAALEGRTARGRYRITCRDGTTRFLETINMPMRGADGDVQVLSVTRDLTDLIQEEEKFRHLLDSSPDAMIIADEHGVMRIVNLACETMFGYARSELIGKPVEMLLPERWRDEHARHRDRYASQARVRSMGLGKPLKGLRRNGAEFPVEIALGPIRSKGETLVCATVRDLTGVREFELALKEIADQVAVHTGQEYFDELVKYLSSHFGLHIAIIGLLDQTGENIETRAVGCDGRLESNFTYSLAGTPCAHVVRDRPHFHESGLQETYPDDHWFREVGAHGYAGMPLHDTDGNVIGMISAVSKTGLANVPGIESFFKLATSRASAEFTRLRQIDEIRESELRYRLVERGTTDGLWDLNMRTGKVHYSSRVSELLGLSSHELGDNPETFWARVHPDDVLTARESRHTHLHHDKPFDVQYRIRHANGSYRWFRGRGQAIRDTTGTLLRFAGNVTDISEGKRRQLQMKAENTWLAKFAESPPLVELLETIAASGKQIFEGAVLTLWLLDSESSPVVFPSEQQSRLDPQALRLLAGNAVSTVVLNPRSRDWPWRTSDKQFDQMVLETIALEDVAERIAIAISYPPGLPQQRHEGYFMETAARLIRLALEQLRQKEYAERQRLLLENLFESTPEAMIVLDRNDCVLDTNPRFTEIFQFSAEEVRGRPLNELIVPAEFAREAQSLSDTVVRGVNVSCETFRKRKDGSLVPVSILGAAITVSGIEASYFAVYRDRSNLHEAAERLDFQSRHDQLTGLPNRYEFERKLQHAMSASAQDGGCTGVLYFDLDQFKVINDTAGHTRGDQVLKEVVRRLRPLVPAPHVLARLGGDEFGVLIVNGKQGDCERMVQQIRERFAHAPFQVGERTFALNASFGIVAVEAGSELDPHEVLSRADSACFLAKERGRNRVQIHDATDTGLAQRREEMDWISRLNEALIEDRFKLHYQRITPVSGDSDREHHEILLRMVDRDGGMVPPGVFIPPAERFNLMPRIDRWVLERVFTRLGERGREGQSNLVVAVNISGNTLSDESLPEFVVGLFEQHAVRPQSVCFEITETAAIGNFQDALKFMAVVRELGSTVALDDFGSGLSSFRYLKEIAPDFLKIDGSFVREIARSHTDYSMVEAINRVGKIMGVHTIAEFVEDDAILDALRRIGVDYAQGYCLHRPEAWD